ncbi:transferase [Orenia metallireducens]|uniref:Transferase n=1 Tax=Orenia metallireducens TaxID=1413210 RepID=A0A1C0A5Z6_9FIRM|nr:acetyltransferase [Orenia metallireducens]OCL25572.1 transferase [Orenia metallireducens]
MEKIVVIGSGGHAKVVIDILLKRIKNLKENIKIIGILDDDDTKVGSELYGIPVIGNIDKINYLDKDISYLIAIGNNLIRKQIKNKFKNIKYFTAIHPSVIIGKDVLIGEGTVVMPGVVINGSTNIGEHCIINTSAVIDHDNRIENFVHISPNVSLAGEVRIGECSWIGIGSSIIQDVYIGKNTIIGAGSVVTRHIGDNKIAYGVPCKVMGFR